MNLFTKGVHKQKIKQMQKAINIYKNAEYSSIYTTIAFVETLFIMIEGGIWTIYDPKLISEYLFVKYLIEGLSMLVMYGFMVILINKSRKECENKKIITGESLGSRITVISQNIGYISPVICLLAWIVTIPGIQLCYKIGTLILGVILALIIFCVKPNE